jgi:CRP-like cAMP-binding protein
MAADAGSNHFLAGLPGQDRALIVPSLHAFDLVPGEVLHPARAVMRHVYFPRSGVLSLVVPFSDGQWAEAAVVGSNTVIGAMAAIGHESALNQATVQVPGTADRIDAEVLRRCARDSETLRNHLIRHVQALAAQAIQVAGCNAVHSPEQRLPRWLLQCRDLLDSDVLPMTCEFLAALLDINRPSVTLILRALESARIIERTRTRLRVLDVNGLKECSCECYWSIREQFAELVHVDRG